MREPVQFALYPIHDINERIAGFNVFLRNNSSYKIRLTGECFSNTYALFSIDLECDTDSDLYLGDFTLEDLNDRVKIKYNITIKEIGKVFEKNFKPKPDFIFRKPSFDSALNASIYLFPILVSKELEVTEFNTDLSFHGTTHIQKSYKKPDFIHLKAEMNDFIDIHFEALGYSREGLTNFEILQIQLEEAQKFIDNAVMAGLMKVNIVHGIGKGKLQKEIVHLLKRDDRVRRISHEFDHRFGNGSTTVYLY